MPTRRALSSALAVLLAGPACTLSPYHIPPDLVIDPARTPRQKLSDERNSRLRFYDRKGDAAPDARGAAAGTSQNGSERPFVDKFYGAYKDSYDEENDAAKARAFTRYGMTLIDTRCDLFFEQIGRGAQNGDFARREFQSISAALVAALGLTNVGQDAITAVGIGSALGTQSIDNYTTVYFFSPDVSAVQQLVRRAFTTLRTELLAPNQSPQSFDDALSALRIYQGVCTAHEIKRLVTEAITTSRTVARSADGSVAREEAWTNLALEQIAALFDLPTITLREAALIEMLLFDTPRRPTEADVDYLCATLPDRLRAELCTPKQHMVDGVAIQGSVARTIDGAMRGRLDGRLAALRVAAAGAYRAMLAEQAAIVRSSGEEARARRVSEVRNAAEVAALKGQLQAAADSAAKTAAENRLRAAEDKQKENASRLAIALDASKVAGEQATAPARAVGVGVVGAAPATPAPQ